VQPRAWRGVASRERRRRPPLHASMIRLEGITKSYNGRPALRGITAKVDRGEFLYLSGPSGAGKSTFLRLLYRAELPDSGQIVVNNSDLLRMRRRDVAEFRRRLGVIFQDFKLLRRRTVTENVTFVLSLLNLPEKDQQRRAYLVLKQMGLQHRGSAFPDELSGGEQQRVAIARALVLQPDLILADEPTGNLDPERSHELFELFKTINYQGTTVVVATHDRGLIEAHPGRTLFLDRGNVVKDGWGSPS
jgi:cell division transport system ATP-binding protein